MNLSFGIAIKAYVAAPFIMNFFDLMLENHAEVKMHREGILVIFEDMIQHDDIDEWIKQYCPIDSFLLVEAGDPEIIDENWGTWFDNPWNLRRSVSVELNWEGC